MSTSTEETGFLSQGVRLGAGHNRPAHERLRNNRGLPCIVIGHGLGGTRECGLQPYAEKFSQAGFHVLCFDYRGFGSSDGEPRQYVNVRMQLDDWAAAIAHARTLAGVDPERIALWGSSFSGGHVIAAAVEDGKVAAVSNQGSMMDGLASVLFLLKQEGLLQVGKVMAHATVDGMRGLFGLSRHTLPVVGEPGSLAVLTSPGSKTGYLALAPPDWPNEISLSWMFGLALYRPNVMAARLPCPALFCVATGDTVVPPAAMEDGVRRAGSKAEVKRYPVGHFEIYVGEAFQQCSRDQAEFFTRSLKP